MLCCYVASLYLSPVSLATRKAKAAQHSKERRAWERGYASLASVRTMENMAVPRGGTQYIHSTDKNIL